MASPAESPCRSSPSRAGRTDADAGSESSSVHSGETLDRRDVDALGLANRSEEYRLLFRLPHDEVLIQDFNCALQDNILLQGHMYLFVHHICFYSNIFGFETKKTIPFHEVTCVRKAKTAAIFPNAIEILTGGRRHFFGSFLSRDEAYHLILDNWAQHSSDAKAFQDSQDSKLEVSSEDNGTVILEGAAESKRYEDDLSSSYSTKDADTSECKPTAKDSFDINVSKIALEEVQENGTEEKTDHSYPVSPITWLCEDADAPNVPDYFTMVAEAEFPVRVEDFFSFFISDNGFNFLDDFHKRCGDKDFRCSPWRQDKQFGYVRNVSFLHPVKLYLGAKFGNCQEMQKFRVYRNSHVRIETSQQISDVPYGDHFCVEGIWDIKDFIEGDGCTLRVFSNVAFSRKTIFRGKIEQSTKDECREVYASWIKMAQELLKQKNIGASEGGVTDQSRVNRGSTELGNSPKSSEGTCAAVNPASIPCDVTGTTGAVLPIDNPMQENIGTSSLASSFRELWSTVVVPYSKTSHFPLMLVIAFVAILILMQVIVILLLTRSPEVHQVAQDNYMSNLGNYRSDSVEWLEKRVRNLKEEMHLVEIHMERMHHEFAWLKVHLESLEKLNTKS